MAQHHDRSTGAVVWVLFLPNRRSYLRRLPQCSCALMHAVVLCVPGRGPGFSRRAQCPQQHERCQAETTQAPTAAEATRTSGYAVGRKRNTRKHLRLQTAAENAPRVVTEVADQLPTGTHTPAALVLLNTARRVPVPSTVTWFVRRALRRAFCLVTRRFWAKANPQFLFFTSAPCYLPVLGRDPWPR